MKKALLIPTIIAGTITTHIMALLDEQQQKKMQNLFYSGRI